jgi:hypothetical protein
MMGRIFLCKECKQTPGKGLNRTEKKTEKLKKIVALTTAAALGMALLFFAQGARAADL